MSTSSEMERSLRHIKAILLAFLLILILYLMKELSSILLPLFFAFFFAILLQPFVRFFMRFVKSSISIAITTVLALAIFFFIGVGLFNVIQTLVQNSEDILNKISTDLRPFINDYTVLFGFTFEEGELRGLVADTLQSSQFWSLGGSFVNYLSARAASVLMMILYFAGLLSAITHYDDTISYLVGKNSNTEKSLATFHRVKDSVGSYIKVKTLVSLFTGIATGIVCLTFRIEYALLWGFLAFVLNYIPYVGSLIAIIPPMVLGIINADSVSQVIILFVCLEGVQLAMGNVLEPRLMGNSFSINTVAVLFGFVFWAFLWGTSGMLLAVPLTFLFKVILENVSDAQIVVRLMEKKSF